MYPSRPRVIAAPATIVLACFSLTPPCCAAIVSATVSADVNASFAELDDRHASAALADTLLASSAADHSITGATLDYRFDHVAGTLTARSLLVTTKTVSARRGGTHSGDSSLKLDFEIDRDMEFSLAGFWGFDGNSRSNSPDMLEFELSGTNGVLAGLSTTSQPEASATPFSASGLLAAGQYRSVDSGWFE